MKYLEVSRTKLAVRSQYVSRGKWRTKRLTKLQSKYLQAACVDAVTAGLDRCRAVQEYVNRLPTPAALVALAHRTVEQRTCVYRGYEYYNVVQRRVGFDIFKVRAALKALVRTGQLEQTRVVVPGRPRTAHYHLGPTMAARHLQDFFDRLSIEGRVTCETTETTPISIHLSTPAALRLLDHLEGP